jgi:cytoskeletal protein CcmA (bactofilin family)
MREPKGGITNIIGKGTKVNGEIKVEGSIHVDGIIEGNIKVTETLIVGKSGRVHGEIYTRDCFSGGKIEGNLFSDGKVEFKSGAVLKGDLKCKQLIIEEGVLFDGSCKMSEKV